MWDSHIRDSILGNTKLTEVSKSDIVNTYLELLDKNLSYVTIRFFHKVITAVFNMALDDDLIYKRPTDRVLDEISGEQKRRDALTVDQQEELLAYAKIYDRDMYRKIRFLIDTMCRISEFAGLTWEDVDMKNRIIHIDHQMQYLKFPGDEKYTYHIAPTKSKRSRDIPMTDEVHAVLKELRKYYFILRKDYVVDNKTDFLFYTKSEKLINDSSFIYDLDKFMDGYNANAKNKIEHLTPHILRHTGCTRNAESGMDIKVLQYIMGHSNSKITNEVYNHVNAERAKNELLRVNSKENTA